MKQETKETLLFGAIFLGFFVGFAFGFFMFVVTINTPVGQ